MSDETKPTQRAVRACAEWLAVCLKLGWRKSDLDFLEGLWWKYHDSRGNLIGSGTEATNAERADSTHRSEAQK